MGRAFNVEPRTRGWAILYRREVTNYCPGCTHSNWYVGRHIAECAFCGTTLPLREAMTTQHGPMLRSAA